MRLNPVRSAAVGAELYDMLMQGCERAQGYYLGRPLDVDDATACLVPALVTSGV